MYLDRALERWLKDPEKRVKLYIAFNIGAIAVNITIALGLGILFSHVTGFI